MMEHCLLPETSPPYLIFIYSVMNHHRHQTITHVVNSYIQLQFQLVSSEMTLGILCNHSIFVCTSKVRTVVATCADASKSRDYPAAYGDLSTYSPKCLLVMVACVCVNNFLFHTSCRTNQKHLSEEIKSKLNSRKISCH